MSKTYKFPITAEQVNEAFGGSGARGESAAHQVNFKLWEGEVLVSAFRYPCAYGYYSTAVVKLSCGDGIKSVQGPSPYGQANYPTEFEAREVLANQWLAQQINKFATGKAFAKGNFSDITVLRKITGGVL